MTTRKNPWSPKKPKARKGELWKGTDDRKKLGGARPHPEASRWRGGNRLNEK